MRDNRLVVNDREWRTEILQHWPPDGPGDRPTALDVRFHDPGDHGQWVSKSWIPYHEADLSDEGLQRLFRDADERSWRDPEGACWRVRVFRPGTLGRNGDGARVPDGIVSFHRREDEDSEARSQVVAELPPIGLLADDDLERLLARAARSEVGTTPADA